MEISKATSSVRDQTFKAAILLETKTRWRKSLYGKQIRNGRKFSEINIEGMFPFQQIKAWVAWKGTSKYRSLEYSKLTRRYFCTNISNDVLPVSDKLSHDRSIIPNIFNKDKSRVYMSLLKRALKMSHSPYYFSHFYCELFDCAFEKCTFAKRIKITPTTKEYDTRLE